MNEAGHDLTLDMTARTMSTWMEIRGMEIRPSCLHISSQRRSLGVRGSMPSCHMGKGRD